MSHLKYCVENWDTKMDLATFSRWDSTNHVGAIVDGLFAVKSSLFTSESLADDSGRFGQL